MGLRSLAEHIDTTSATGRLVLHVFGALAEFERSLVHERTMAGLIAAGTPVREIAEILGAGRSTLYRALRIR